MTASTDKTQNKKLKKNQGPIRWAAIVPTVIFVALIALYARFAFDNHLRKTIIWTSEYFYGAEINISKINSSLFDGKLQIHGIQVTDKDRPERNLFSIGEINFHLIVSELLKAKFIVDLGEITNIQWHDKRNSSGRIYADRSEKSPQLKKIENTALKVASENLKGNALGNVANILGGSNVKTEFKDIKGQLTTEKKIKELEKDLKQRQAHYENKIKELKDSGKLKELNKKIKSYKWNKKRPFKSLSKANKLIKESSRIYKEYEREIKALRNDIKKLDGSIKNVDKWIEEDMKNLQKMAGVPQLDPEKIAFSLFGEAFGGNVTTIRKYSEIAKEYMPPPKSERSAKDSLIPHKRGEGKTFTFEKKGENPKLWIKEIKIQSKSNQSKFSGDLVGVIKDITNAPQITGKPTLFTLKGDFPNQKLYGVAAHANLNHHLENPNQTLSLQAKKFPFPRKTLNKSKDLKIFLEENPGSLLLKGRKEGEIANISLETSLPDPKFKVESPKKVVKEIVSNSLANMDKVTMSASAAGKWEDLKWKFRSNIAKELSRGLKKGVNNQVKKAKAELRKKLMAKIEPLKRKYKDELDKTKNKLQDQLKKEEQKVKQESKNALSKLKSQQKNSTKGKSKKLEKSAKKFLKKLF